MAESTRLCYNVLSCKSGLLGHLYTTGDNSFAEYNTFYRQLITGGKKKMGWLFEHKILAYTKW